MSLKSVLTHEMLQELAGGRSFARGEAYADDGRVSGLIEDGERVIAEVQGTHDYHVELWLDDDGLAYECDCPVGTGGVCCKHCVAVGLALLDECARDNEPLPSEASSTAVTMDDVRDYLRGLSPEALVEMMMEQVRQDAELREGLLLRIARSSSRGIDLQTYRKAIDRAIAVPDYVDYEDSYSYTSDAERVLDSLEDLLLDGHGEEALMLIEYAVPLLDRSVEQVDDSSGYLSSVIEQAQELHYKACAAAKPDPETLAKNLFTWMLENDYLTFDDAVERYAELIGESGLATYRALVEAEWARLPALVPRQTEASLSGNRRRITCMMESLAIASGDVDALVAIKSRDLSFPYTFLQIAVIYQEAGRHDEALEWAERGLRAFPERTDARLRQWLVEEYHRRSRHGEAMAILWQAFTEKPTLAPYQALSEYASRIGQWEGWRERAWTKLRAGAAKMASQRYAWDTSAGYSELVRILLWEEREEEAWQEANAGGCADDLWMQLAALREAEYPEDAVKVYLHRIPPTLNRTNNESYDTAIDLLRKIQPIMSRLNRQAEFQQYVVDLRAEFKRKRNFIKLLDAGKW